MRKLSYSMGVSLDGFIAGPGDSFASTAPLLAQRTMACDHLGTRSGASRYLREVGKLRLILVCDQCGAECSELGTLDYRTKACRSVAQSPALTVASTAPHGSEG
jgi:hypothetical protein